MNSIQKFYDKVFGNNDGKFTAKDLPNKAVLIVGLVVDLLYLLAEWRVYSVGLALTGSFLLALGFVAISSVPFYLGQLAFMYNQANKPQQWISVLMVLMGLFVSAYYGFADYILQTNTQIQLANGVLFNVDVNTLYILAVSGTVALIVGGLLFVFVDDTFANNLTKNRIQAKARLAREEIAIRRDLLLDLTSLRADEEALRRQYPDDYDILIGQFAGKENPTSGNGNKR